MFLTVSVANIRNGPDMVRGHISHFKAIDGIDIVKSAPDKHLNTHYLIGRFITFKYVHKINVNQI